jgi:large subunit ribosomal protein L17
MRHRVSGRKFDRPGDQRKALLRGLVGDLMRHERLKTTEAKAKEVRPIAERMITLGKDGTLHARRQALAYINDKDVVSKLFDDIAPRFASRPGGYTRITKLGPRKGDGSLMAQIELVEGSGA